MERPLLSIVSPVYKAEQILKTLVSEIHLHASGVSEFYEIVLVDDGSPDRSWEVMEKICQEDDKVVGIKLSRNFGQHYAITAGLQHAKGEWVVVMDCDLQDRPEEIPNLYACAVRNKYHLVFARRTERMDGRFKKMSSKLFYKLLSYLTDTKQDPAIANYGIYHRKVVSAILEMKDHIRYFPTMSQWVGFNRGELNVKHGQRVEGQSTYTFWKLFVLALNNMLAFSDKPLWLAIRLGLFVSIISAFIGLYYVVQYFAGYIIVSGFASLIISLWFLSGLIILILGVVGVYVGKTFEKVKGRPIYIVEQRCNYIKN